jgi:hypothetical protein
MTVRQYINHLEQLARENGDDITVQSDTSWDGRGMAKKPHLAHERILKGRERKPAFFMCIDSEDRRGQKCIRVQ